MTNNSSDRRVNFADHSVDSTSREGLPPIYEIRVTGDNQKMITQELKKALFLLCLQCDR